MLKTLLSRHLLANRCVIAAIAVLFSVAVISSAGVPAWAVTSADVAAAKEKQELAKQNVADAWEEVNRLVAASKKDAWDFYASLPDGAGQEAITILDQNQQNAWTHKGDERDATSLENMLQAVQGLERCNELRLQDGKSELKVSITMMAVA